MTTPAEAVLELEAGRGSWDAALAACRAAAADGDALRTVEWTRAISDAIGRAALPRERLDALLDALRSGPKEPAATIARVPADYPTRRQRVLADKFVLESRLGGGGMGEVWRARDLDLERLGQSNPYYAIKLLNANARAIPQASLLLQKEAVRTQKLAHRNIVRVHMFGTEKSTGDDYVMMELVEGDTLESLLQRHPAGMPWDAAAPLIRQLCAGLAYAHGEGLVHSDFKPGNVLVDRHDVAKILDFGIATPLRAAGETTRLTAFDPRKLGALTPRYAPLEMWINEPPAPADDVYSLACVVYEILSGRHPFDGDDAVKAMTRHARPAAIASLGTAANDALRAALAFRRADRTPTVEQFEAALFAAPAARATPQAGTGDAISPDGRVAPQRRRLYLAAAVACGLVAGIGFLWSRASVESPPSIPPGTGPAAAAEVAATPGSGSAAAAFACDAPASRAAVDEWTERGLRAQLDFTLAADEATVAAGQRELGRVTACLEDLAAAGFSTRESRALLRDIAPLLDGVPRLER